MAEDSFSEMFGQGLEALGEQVKETGADRLTAHAEKFAKQKLKQVIAGGNKSSAEVPQDRQGAPSGTNTEVIEGEVAEESNSPPLSGMHKVYEEGRLSRQSLYQDGVLHGETLFFDEKGLVEKKLFYEKGVLHGPCFFFSEGVLVLQSNYKDGKQEGAAIAYKENGCVLSRLTYKAGLQEGMAVYYDDEGFPAQTQFYVSNKKEGPFVAYYPSGLVLRSGQFQDGLEEGTFAQYYEDRSLMQVVVYSKGHVVKGPVDYPPPQPSPKKKG